MNRNLGYMRLMNEKTSVLAFTTTMASPTREKESSLTDFSATSPSSSSPSLDNNNCCRVSSASAPSPSKSKDFPVSTTTDDEHSSSDDVEDSGSSCWSVSSGSSSHLVNRKRKCTVTHDEAPEEESSCCSPKDGASPSLPDYCRTLRITDSHGHVRELIFPRGLDLDRPKRARTTFSADQLDQLEREFVRNPYLVGRERSQLAHKLELSETQVKVWFQNRRTKQKRDEQRASEQRQSNAEGLAAGNVLRLLQQQTPFRFVPAVASSIQKGNPFLPLPPPFAT